MDKCYECGAEGVTLKHVSYEDAEGVAIIEQDLCETCFLEADDYLGAYINEIEVVNVVKEV